MNQTMEHWLDKRAALTPNDIAIETPDHRSWTFYQLQQHVHAFAKKLAGISLTDQRPHIAILSENSIDMVTAFLACTYLRIPVAFLNTRLSPSELQKQCLTADVGFMLTSKRCFSKGMDAVEGVKDIAVESFAMVEEKKEEPGSLHKLIYLDDICSMMFTSGTTGTPKAVMHTYENHWSSAIASSLNLGLLPNDKWLACLPLFHIGGLSIIMKSLIYGMPVYLLEKFDESKVHQAIMDHEVTIVSVVAVTCKRLLDTLGDSRYPKAFRCMLLGGGPAPKSLLQQAKAVDVPVVQTYGMTETSSQISTLSATDAWKKIGSAGKPLFQASLQVCRNGKPLACNEIGDIMVKGPMVTNGYYKREDANQQAFQNGWLITGDLGYIDKEGFLYVVDRRSDLIISGGENIYPAEVEEVLLSYPGIQEAGIVGKEDVTWGKVPVAFIVAGADLEIESLQDYCSTHLASFKVPKSFFVVDALPRNATNKLQRHKLKDWLQDDI
ncbi:o-succinylbenzoate--CoA ligase [Gracilibacillus sp. YIM 98692]|uniref:o-succinylbenzoate--CoA ligase n=1 Tax=Gracilibacillus sp. YIM 98692 TaxID=2663532 RepID=UPI0013D333D0|nr:o-succinylbenzoate--CoA ligase [Gracilibacillus sp. YIM 98692]